MIKKKIIPLILLAVIILSVISCSLKNTILAEDESAKKNVTSSINDYASNDWEVRLAAIKKASLYKDTIYSKNILLLMLLAADDYHPLVQIEALKTLGKIKSYIALEKLHEIARNEKEINVKREALTALQDYSLETNIDIFIANINDRDWLIREAAYIGLLKIQPEDIQRRYIGTILKGLNDKNISVRIAILNNVKIKDPSLYNEISGIIRRKKTGISLLKGALTAIKGYTFDEKTRERLFELLTHRNKDVRVLSLQALKMEKIELNF